MIAALEPRLFLSSSLKSGVLTVTGTSGNNAIAVSLVTGKIRVAESGLANKEYTTSSVSKIIVDGKAGNDKITVASAITKNCEIRGGTGNDTLRGGGGTDALLGQDGNDNLEGGAKNDYLDGGRGLDKIDYSSRTSSIKASLHYYSSDQYEGSDGAGGGTGESDQYASVEAIAGTSKADQISFDSSAESSPAVARSFSLAGGAGNDLFMINAPWLYLDPKSLSVVVHGNAGEDTFEYTVSYPDKTFFFYGDDGNDRFQNIELYETADPGPTPPYAYHAFVDGGAGYDVDQFLRSWFYNRTDYQVPPGVEEAHLSLYASADFSATGNELDNKMYIDVDGAYSDQASVIDGRGGNDYVEVALSVDSDSSTYASIRGGLGNDTIVGSDLDDCIYGDGGNDVIYGGTGNDYIEGGSGNDTITGGAGKDKLFGGSGDDLLNAKDSEKDTIDGGSGIDKAQRDVSLDVLTSIESLA